jgi:Raf kinase inhibitor-like YbhB/YbcL family protein
MQEAKVRISLLEVGLVTVLAACAPGLAASSSAFTIKSPDVAEGRMLSKDQVYSGYGCTGANISPAFEWAGAPAGTKSFAFTVFDPDAPTGHGWWHWIVFDIPAAASGLPRAVGKSSTLPKGAREGKNDFEVGDFGGACPPVGDKPHRYEFTIHALKVERLDAPENATLKAIESLIRANEIGSARVTAKYGR